MIQVNKRENCYLGCDWLSESHKMYFAVRDQKAVKRALTCFYMIKKLQKTVPYERVRIWISVVHSLGGIYNKLGSSIIIIDKRKSRLCKADLTSMDFKCPPATILSILMLILSPLRFFLTLQPLKSHASWMSPFSRNQL